MNVKHICLSDFASAATAFLDSFSLSSTLHDFSRNKSRPRSVRYIKKFIVCPASGALVKIFLLLFSLHVLLVLVCVKSGFLLFGANVCVSV